MKEKFRFSYKGAIDRSSNSFSATFGGKFPIDFEAYEEKKESATFNPFDEKAKAKKIVDKKKGCEHRAWRYVRSKNEWYCQACGYTVNKNPYLDSEPRKKVGTHNKTIEQKAQGVSPPSKEVSA